MPWTIWMALVVVCIVVWALIKRYETRLVLLVAGLVMACLSMDPLAAFKQFDKSMTNASLIIAICSAMGFAGVVSLTKCDAHLVRLLTSPLKKLGILLLPASMVVTGIVSIALPTMAGLSAAIGPTMIPILVRAGFKPATAAGSIAASLLLAYFNPGVSHNPFIAKLAGIGVMDFIGNHATMTAGLWIANIVIFTLVAILYKDYDKNAVTGGEGADHASNLPDRANIFYAIAPLIPVAILVLGNIYAPQLKLSVATAMLLGMIYCLAVTRTNPQEASKRFFDGMGKGYAAIIGIIIAAGVFAAGLKASGLIAVFVDFLTHANEVAKIGGSVGPFLLGLITGSGDAAAFAFNEAVTVHAPKFGMTIDGLGYLAMMAAGLGRQASPLAGGIILLSGIAQVNPLEVVRRTAPPAVVLLGILYFFTV